MGRPCAWLAALALTAAAGCSAGVDPENGRLEAGSQAVVVIPDGWLDKSVTVFSSGKPWESGPKRMFTVPPGVRVTVGSDPGFFERTQADIDRSVSFVTDNPELQDHMRKERPAKYHPPDPKAKERRVAVVIETGEHKEGAGYIERRSLRPAAPQP